MYLAGSVRVQVGEKVVIDAHHTRRRAKALLVYLYLKRGRLVSKNQILADLWPDAEAADPGRVKHTVQVLRSTLEGARPAAGWSYILELDGACSFNIEAQRWTDLEEFESELASAAHFRALNQVDDTLEHYRRGLALR